MTNKHLLTLILPLSFFSFTYAADLESILEGGSPSAEKTTVVAKTTALAQSIKKNLGTASSEQNIFLRYLENAEWDKALLQFSAAFEGTAFQKTASGRALKGFVQFKAGLPVTGVQTLFMAENPKEINITLREEWQRAAPMSHFVWDLAQVVDAGTWKNDWEVVFGEDLQARVKAAKVLTETPEVETLKKLSSAAVMGSKEKAQLDWQLVIAYSLNDQADLAAKLLANLIKSPQAPVSQDLMQITAARLLFQNGYFDAAVKYYEKIPKASAYWTEAQEEMGWAYIRKGEPNNALALTESLVHSGMNYQVSPEAFFVRALSQLKICDYSGVTQSLALFPKRFKERTGALKALSTEPATAAVEQGLALLKNRKIAIQDLGKNAQNLPRRFANDERLYRFVQAQKYLQDEAQVAEKLYAQSLALTGLQGSFEQLKQNTLQRAQMARSSAYGRVKELAQAEVEETKEVLRKLHIVEAEVIQQVSLAEKIAKNAKGNEEKKGRTGAKGQANVLRFPAEEEVWFDEISNYRVDVKKACTVKN